jgi:N-acetylneuraminic acid mutarotase
VDGALAPGLGVTPDGYFQGVPTQAGEFEITFNVHDQCDPPQWVKKKLSFLVVGAAPETLTWVEETPLPNDLAGAAAGYLGVAPCVAGGDTGVGKQTNAFLCYDKDDKSWNELEPMLQGRAWPGFATVGLTLYVFGGFYLGPGYLDHCEYYNTAEPGWKVCSPMPTARSGLKAAEIGGKIYAVGGYDGTKGLTTAERYDPLTDSWSMLPAMPTPRTAPAVASAEGRLYVFGGMSKVTDEYINVLEVFDPAENSWQKAPAMPVAKGAAAAIYAPPFNAILIVGGQGYDGPGQIMASNKVERYDVTTATWSIYEGGMPGYRGDLMGLWSLAGGPQHIMAIGGEANLDKQNSFYVGYFDL